MNQLALNYGMKAMPALRDILSSIPSGEDVFKAYCVNAISKLRQSEDRAVGDAGFLGRKS